MSRSPARRYRHLALVLAVAGACAVIAIVILDSRRTPDVDCGSFRFNSALWRQWEGDGPNMGPDDPRSERFPAKHVAAQGLIECGLLIGKTKRGVRALLEVPAQSDYEVDRWDYTIGPGQGLLGRQHSVETELSVVFDAEDRVKRAVIESRRF